MRQRDMAAALRARILSLGSPERARGVLRYFKTALGEYGEGDVFVGVSVPELRRVAREYRALSLAAVFLLLRDPVHEVRMFALLLLVDAFQRGDPRQRELVYRRYLKSARFINNWDLVDVSAAQIVGAWLLGRDTSPLDTLARSPVLWERRISIVATHLFIRQGCCTETLRIAEALLKDKEDLIHKATGWMLREVDKRDPAALDAFLAAHRDAMPRTMLRYALERRR